MLTDVKVPVLAESVSEATLMQWHKHPGDMVKRGDSLIDIETDKVTLEIVALNDGTLIEVIKNDGALVESDEVIARIETKNRKAVSASSSSTPEETPALAAALSPPGPGDVPAENKIPRTGPAVRNIAANEQVNLNDVPRHTIPDRVTKDDLVGHFEQRDAAPLSPTPEPVSEPTPTSVPPDGSSTPESAAKTPESAAKTPEPVAKTPEPAAKTTEAVTTDREEQRVPMTRLRARAAAHLLSAQHESAILTTFNEVNMQPVMAVRTRHKEEFAKQHGVKLGFMSFFTKAVVEALKKFPVINASVDGQDILYHNYFDIGIAVSAPRGLVVPVVRDANLLSLADIEMQIRELSDRARDNKLTMDDLSGGTFTITNGGVFGSMLSTPIINPPQSAILGMHNIQQRPVVEGSDIVARPIMYLALSYDHRIIDGSEAVRFLVSIKTQLEDPTRMLLQL